MKSRADQIQADAEKANRKLRDMGFRSLREALDEAEKCKPKKRKRIHKLVDSAGKYRKIPQKVKSLSGGRAQGGLIYSGGGVLQEGSLGRRKYGKN